jgi:hypothetical protein
MSLALRICLAESQRFQMGDPESGGATPLLRSEKVVDTQRRCPTWMRTDR